MAACVQVLDENEEVLLHVFGGTLPFSYELGVYSFHQMNRSRLASAGLQVDTLLKVCISADLLIVCNCSVDNIVVRQTCCSIHWLSVATQSV